MNEKEKKQNKWLAKLKNVKHIEIYVAIIFIVILLLIYLSSYSTKETKATNELTITTYVEDIEKNLEEILSNIGGVKNVKVMITLDMASAELNDSKITLNKFPNIKGVIVTAEGVENTAIKLKVLHAVESVLEITNGNIEILSSK